MQHLHGDLAAFRSPGRSPTVQARVRFLAYHRIKPHAPPLVRAPVNSFEFQPCDRTPQAGRLSLSLGRRLSVADDERPSFTAWTTRVSNPVRSPRFRARASMQAWPAASAIGVLWHIYAFHRYTPRSAGPDRIPARQYRRHSRGWAPAFHRRLDMPPAHPLSPMNPDNARILRITAAAGTELADAYSLGTLKLPSRGSHCPRIKEVHDP